MAWICALPGMLVALPKWRAVEIGVVPGNGGDAVQRDRLGESCAEVGIRGAAIANVPTGVDIQLHQIGEPSYVGGRPGFAALQSAELVEVDRIGALRFQISIQEGRVAFSSSVLLEIYCGAITIKVRQSDLVVVQRLVRVYLDGRIGADTAQFGVLLPEIRSR